VQGLASWVLWQCTPITSWIPPTTSELQRGFDQIAQLKLGDRLGLSRWQWGVEQDASESGGWQRHDGSTATQYPPLCCRHLNTVTLPLVDSRCLLAEQQGTACCGDTISEARGKQARATNKPEIS
jgi:hypothetical protein